MTQRLEHLYVCEQKSTRAVAAATGIDRQRVARLLARAGVALRPRGAGGRRPHRRAQEPAHLADLLVLLYVQRGLSSTQIGTLLSMPPRTVRDRLAEAGIARRSAGHRPRTSRRTLSSQDLQALYVQAGLPARDVGHLLGVSGGIVLDNAHDLGLPVRLGGLEPGRGPAEIELIDALYDDEQVARTLARHAVPVRPAGTRLWERLPRPIPLTPSLLEDLYHGCGISIAQIELLTGQPAATIARRLRAAGIELRPPGGRCPFLRRWRASSRSTARARTHVDELAA
jgi:hypothetical protein